MELDGRIMAAAIAGMGECPYFLKILAWSTVRVIVQSNTLTLSRYRAGTGGIMDHELVR
jgi:hypothetical protein